MINLFTVDKQTETCVVLYGANSFPMAKLTLSLNPVYGDGRTIYVPVVNIV